MGSAIQIETNRTKNRLIAIGWVTLFLATIVAYYPGLQGPFVLDDVINIAALGDNGGVTDWQTFLAFVFGGHSGPTGRPLSLATFLIDASNWPATPYSFKRTNLIIHLANGVLLGALINQILGLIQYDARRARWVVLFCVAGWLLHPFLVSTTLYVVQRMTQLSAMFVFAGLAGFLYGRSLLNSNKRKAYLLMTVSIGLFTVLSTLSKENGVLLPLLAGVLEATIIASQGARLGKLDGRWSAAAFGVPAVIIIVYLGSRIASGSFFDLAPYRDFSIYERLITQPRVLLDYLWHWFVPNMYTPGVFQDHFVKSSGWLSPATTLFSALFHAGVIAVSIIYRRKWPVLALATLFFYTGHVLEGSVLNLELYFEHRNYLPAALLFLPVSIALIDRLDRRVFFTVAGGLIIMLAAFTHYSASIWSDYSRMVEASAKQAPGSVRAQARYATILFDSQRYEESLQVLDRAVADIPGHHDDLLVNRLFILCNLGILNAAEYEKTEPILAKLYFRPGKFFLYRAFVNSVATGRCAGLPIESLRPLFVEMLNVPENRDTKSFPYSQLNYLVGLIDVHAGDVVAASDAFIRSLSADPSSFVAMRMARKLASNKYYDEALEFVERAAAQLEAEQRSGLGGADLSEVEIRDYRDALMAERDDQQDGADVDQDR